MTYSIVTKFHANNSDDLRQWCYEHIGEPYRDWKTFFNYPTNTVGVTVYNKLHATLIVLMWS